ncbi:adenylosuccinate synthetase [Candidatus Woesearchaeota archaeon]|nr:adenylosuccinate synthetase [Candidatus Woesearchaeota archaeon]MBI2582561.1 adenylosuccinate synthetase [Candidatus Woesearchaeota archaeon]
MNPIREAYVGLSWGDEGKGKFVDEALERAQLLAPEKRRIVVRYQGGPNAGHTLYISSAAGLIKFVTHSSPTGLACNADLGIGPNCAFDPESFLSELKQGQELFDYQGRVLISERVGILFDYHRKLDAWRESGEGRSIGTTKSGIGPFYEDNARRLTRVTFADYVSDNFPDLLREVLNAKSMELSAAGILKPRYLEEVIAVHDPIRRELKEFKERLEYRMLEYLEGGHHIIIEGAQGTELDVDMGTIPDQTSSHTPAPHAFPSLGLPRGEFKIYGVEKVYPTRVGNGLMPTLADDAIGDMITKNAGEFGAKTGRKRRAGYPNWAAIKRAVRINDCDGIYITRVDCIQDVDIKVCTGFQIDGKVTDEVPLDLSQIEKPVYQERTYQWKLWDGPRDLSNPLVVDQVLKEQRERYIQGGFDSFPPALREYVMDHDAYVGCKTAAVSIGPARGETVRREQ